jgi:hypothetical protein
MKFLLLLYLFLEIIEAARHTYLIQVKKRSPNKLLSWCLRAAVAIPILYWEPRCWWQAGIIYGFAGWFTHDYLLNFFRGVKPIWYLNDTGWIDKLQNAGPGPAISMILKGIAAGSCVAAYLFNDWNI